MSQSTPPQSSESKTTPSKRPTSSPTSNIRSSTSYQQTSAQRTTKLVTLIRSTAKPTETDDTTSSPAEPTNWVEIGVAVGMNLLAIAIITGLVCWWRARKKRRREREEREDVDLESQDNPAFRSSGRPRATRSPSQDYVNAPDEQRPSARRGPRPSIAGIADGWEVPEENIKLLRELGSGQFGKVYKGEAYGIDRQERWKTVAIKTLRTEDQKAQEDFVKEQRVMSKLQHAQLVRLLGCCTTSDPMYLIMEYMENGDLAKFLRDNHDGFHPDGPCPGDHQGDTCLTPKRLTSFANDIAKGMGHLENKKIVHRDLAARNILLDKDYRCKVSDFGLARAMYDAESYMIQDTKRPLPVFWMSLESLYDGEFTSKSDVWAFGIVLWELFTLGGRPYPGMDGMEVQHQLKRGYRMPKPRNCSDEMYNLMRWCWEREPEQRPHFKQLVAKTNELKQDRARPGAGGRRPSADVSGAGGRRPSADVSGAGGRRPSVDVLPMAMGPPRRDSGIGRFDVFLQ